MRREICSIGLLKGEVLCFEIFQNFIIRSEGVEKRKVYERVKQQSTSKVYINYSLAEESV